MSAVKDFGLYVIITRPVLPYERIAEICAEEGVRMLQLREKHLPDREMLAVCRRLAAVTRGSDTKLIVDDRADIALLGGADGVHLGQTDLTLEEARCIVGPGRIIGLSTHSLAQAREAIAQSPDYIGFGPVYPTPTKAIPDPTVGTQLLREAVALSPVPVVAIGGIDAGNLHTVTAAGARNLCCVRYLMESPDLRDRIRELRRLMDGAAG